MTSIERMIRQKQGIRKSSLPIAELPQFEDIAQWSFDTEFSMDYPAIYPGAYNYCRIIDDKVFKASIEVVLMLNEFGDERDMTYYLPTYLSYGDMSIDIDTYNTCNTFNEAVKVLLEEIRENFR